ncbi:FHA domain-containing protein [Rubinisphaera margarita]|uniref:FHA domain-containing protein n=1 Tax=Rubinisphaera margarita TaxID=2909586 RepID=UPI001EE8417B|nr:FHA domain-containing protein [Rubinisphaera margarita]MCG6158068.1 FHA domain-containing protein [Rubinisphaera margarita]
MPARLQPLDSTRTVSVDKPILFVGRHPECDLVINTSRKVSRKHCCLAEINGKFLVRDLGSTNGVQINGKRVSGTKELNSGDELVVGDVVYTFFDASAPKQKAAAPPPSPPLSDDGVPFRDNTDSKTDSREIVHYDHELSSDIPVMIDEEDEAFEDYSDGPSYDDLLSGSDSRN